ncbi:Proline-, glutamic acid- and leucine-rich protein 1 [Larimichthys crocea]|uniref:Proline-, glutamic acid- and leucine-rich protein 1 n=2 Tax=Larimichthys crocea TaxID=215358 RepID=A0A6G0HHX5_LARCR|nr:proline-, glutamic acid- and leucine-rich protein 1 [Larimichthys crocea]KAE8278795.1 Proline-, glutamic acid- and leucine-rich protein 1 [Larimichthys crocea]
MATSAWLRGPSALRLTEALVSVLKEQRPEYLPALLANYREHGVFPTQGASSVGGLVGFTNAKLGSSKTRFEGLCLLSMLVKDSSSDLFQQHCLSWLRSLQQVIQSQAPVQTIQLAVNILKDVLQYSSQLAELAREVGLNSILGILTSLLGLKTECELAAMEGMTACMTYYPRACGSLKDKLGAYFLSKMDSTNKKTQEMACQCYGCLPCLGGLLDRGVGAGRAEGWTSQIHCLLASANGQLAQIYQGSETDGTVQYEGPGVELAFPHLDQSDPLLLLQLQHRYTAVCMALKHTLRVDPASAVRLPVRPILNLVCRALAVSSKSINLTGDGSVRLLVLPIIHTNTLEVLSALITAVRSGMVQYAAVLQRLFSQTLSAWTPVPESSLGQQRAYSSVRVSVHRTLELWVQVAGASASIFQGSPGHSELLFSHLLGDITPGAESIKLRAGLSADAVPGGKPGPRRTKPLVMADTVGPSLQRKGDLLANQDTCLSALRALRQIILTSGTLLKDDIHKRLHDVVLPLCVRLQQQQSSSNTVCETAGSVSGQYSSALTRRELYRLLLALVLVPSPCWPPPLTCAVSILSNGCIDRNLKVSTFCTESLTICNSLIHPRTPSITLPLPPLAMKPTPTAPVLPTSQGPTSGLTLPALLGGPAPGPSFPTRHSLGLGPASLLGSLENHLSLVPGLPGQAPTPGDMILSPHAHHQQDPAGLGLPESQRPVFIRYDREEADDVEISLASDSDDSVVIVPPGMLNMENQQDETAAANSQNMASAAPGGATVTLPGGESVTMVPTTSTTTTMDEVSLPNDLATSSPLLTTSTTPINSFPPSNASVVSLVPPLSSSTLTAPPGGLGDSLPGRPQLQQMLMQPSTPGPIGLPLQIHQLQNQLSQQGRHLHQHQPPPPANNEDSGVININSTDDEEEEDMEDDEELEEEEEGMDEEDEEEEVSDFAEEEFYDGEEYEDYDEEEGEELEEEEEEEDGDIPPLEGAEDKAGEVGIEEGKMLRAAVDEGGMAGFSVEGETEGGIEEIQTNRALFREDRMKVQEVESIGVLEEAREGEGEGEEDENERMDDPTMPQILCVTGGALEEREEAEEEGGGGEGGPQEEVSWEEGANETQPKVTSEECKTDEHQQESGAEPAQEAAASDNQPSCHQEGQLAAVQGDVTAADPETLTDQKTKEEEETDAEQRDKIKAEQQETEEGQGRVSDEEEGKGVKRKREEVHREEEAGQSTEKKKLDDDTMASMLADFVACPPDDEDGASGSNHS